MLAFAAATVVFLTRFITVLNNLNAPTYLSKLPAALPKDSAENCFLNACLNVSVVLVALLNEPSKFLNPEFNFFNSAVAC